MGNMAVLWKGPIVFSPVGVIGGLFSPRIFSPWEYFFRNCVQSSAGMDFPLNDAALSDLLAPIK
jgi:hypothetical protein